MTLKKTEFDKIIEKQNQKVASRVNSRGSSNNQQTNKPPATMPTKASESEMRICMTFRKLGQCRNGDNCQMAHNIKDIKYYRPQSRILFLSFFIVWKNVLSSIANKDYESNHSDSNSVSLAVLDEKRATRPKL